MKHKVGVAIITLNEEKNIRRAIKSAKKITDEIVVVDSGSTDHTIKIAKELGAKVFNHLFVDYASQKNHAASLLSSEWIFSLDADEEISDELAEELLSAIKDVSFDGYLIPRRNIILKGEIKHSRWSPDKHIWLWRKDKGTWEGKIHEEVVVRGKVGELQNAKLHYQDETIFEFLSMLNAYTQIEAEQYYKEGIRYTNTKLLWYPLRSFVGRYILKQGYLDGWRGFVLCMLRAMYHAVIWLKLLELQKQK